MDEHRMAESIVKKVLELSGRRGIGEVIVNVGEVSGTNYNRLFAMLKLLSIGTAAEDATIRFNHRPVHVKCNCGYSGDAPVFGLVEKPIVECPSCSRGLCFEIARGRGVSLRDISVI